MNVQAAELAPPDGEYFVALDVFEGPLDLLLHLVRRHELDILDIPIAFITEKYLEYLAFIRALDLEVAGDYLVMAATLAYLKSRELLPPEPTDEEAEAAGEEGPDPRQELIARLLAYEQFRDAAQKLGEQPVEGRDTFARGGGVDLPPLDQGLVPITLFRLADAFHRVLTKAKIRESHEVVLETVTVADRMQQLTMLLIERERLEFEKLFLEREWSSVEELRSMLIVTLMSILELVKLGVAGVYQGHDSSSIQIERRADADTARRAIAGYDEAISFGTASESGASPGPEAPAAQAETGAVAVASEPEPEPGLEPQPEVGSEIPDADVPAEALTDAADDAGGVAAGEARSDLSATAVEQGQGASPNGSAPFAESADAEPARTQDVPDADGPESSAPSETSGPHDAPDTGESDVPPVEKGD